MNANEKDRTFEVMKFAIMAVLAILPSAIGYGILQNRVAVLEKDSAKHEMSIDSIVRHNQKQDLQTATWRTNTDNRIQNIEKLTQDIHRAVVGQ